MPALLLVLLLLPACGAATHGPSRAEVVRRAGVICQSAAVPGIPSDPGAARIPNRAARMASLSVQQERREVERLRAIGSDDAAFEAALRVFERALPQLDRFVREARAGHARAAAAARASYDASIVLWQSRAAAAGLDVCSRFGFVF